MLPCLLPLLLKRLNILTRILNRLTNRRTNIMGRILKLFVALELRRGENGFNMLELFAVEACESGREVVARRARLFGFEAGRFDAGGSVGAEGELFERGDVFEGEFGFGDVGALDFAGDFVAGEGRSRALYLRRGCGCGRGSGRRVLASCWLGL